MTYEYRKGLSEASYTHYLFWFLSFVFELIIFLKEFPDFVTFLFIKNMLNIYFNNRV